MGELQKVSDIFLEEQEWVPGYQAPFLLWVAVAGAAGFIALSAVWIYQHNK